MKKIIIILAILTIAPLANATSTVHLKELAARDADSCYRVGDYAGAIEAYEAVLADGFTSAELYYNLGNAYYRTDDIPRAILNYERALRLRPSMTDARENLALAQSHTIDHIDNLPRLFIARWIDALRTGITPAVWRVLWLLLLALTAAAVLTVAIGRDTTLRRWGLGIGIGVGILFLISTAFLISSTHWRNAHSEAIVMQQSVSVKGSPENQSTDKMILHAGTRVHISESLEGWDKITIADGTSGWCPANAIERI